MSLSKQLFGSIALVSLNSSVIDLCDTLFDWAIKLLLILDHDGPLPSFAVTAKGKVSDVKAARF